MIRTLLLAASPLLVAAETPGLHLSVPVLGYVFDESSSSVRQVTGVPGAAGLEQPVELGTALAAAWVHSSTRTAVVITKDGILALANWRNTPALTPLDTELGPLTAAAFGAGGDSVALSDGTAVEVWSGVLSQPRKSGGFVPDGGVVALAARLDGAVAVATGAGTILLYEGGIDRTIAAGGSWTALAFAGSDVLAADAGELVRISENGGRTVVTPLGSSAKALAVSQDGRSAALALAGDLLLVHLDGSATPVACGCSATALAALEGNLVIHLGGAEGAVRVLDADALEPRVLEIHQ